ncbi:MAG: serine/threonine-protein kinase [Holophaga sp.]|nr:serine/threonine-protein kinase [Holophaga sp.]
MSTESPLHQPDWLEVHQPSVGRYILGPILGLGGAGEVREAWDVVLCRTVALKVLRKMEPVGLIRFMHEAQIQSRIVHPNICRIYDVDNSGGVPKIAMQLVRGPTLSQLAPELTVKQIVVILAQVAEAIHAAHRLQLIHRDLKPSNILLERDPAGTWIPFVCDFGLAMALDEPSITLGPGLIGTPAFMAPEQILGERELVGPATDVFALGATLHFALYGEPPVAATGELTFKRTAVFPPNRNTTPDLPRDLETILSKSMERDPKRRYGSALALADDLWLFAQGAPIHARPVGALEHRWRQFQRYRLLALTALVCLGVLVTGRLVEMSRLTRQHAAQAEATRSFMLEAADLEKDVRLEKMMPAHDLRPMYARIQARIEGIQARMRDQGPWAQGPAYFALGRARFMKRDYLGAQRELEQGWAQGFRTPDLAWLLAQTLMATAYRTNNTAIYTTGRLPPGAEALARRAQELLVLGRAAEDNSPEYAECTVAFLQHDYRKAAACAHAAFLARPWQSEAAAVESLCRSGVGRRLFIVGDLRGAERNYREARAAAEHYLAIGHSDPFTLHAYFVASARLALVQLVRGNLTLARIDELHARCERALGLDRSQQELQDDWIQICLLRVMLLQRLGRDCRPDLYAGLGFLNAWAREPLSAELRADRMVIHFRLAECSFQRGGNPDPDLAEAMKDMGHTLYFRHRDYLGDLLNFKARVEQARGQDPRPTLADALARMEPTLEQGSNWTACETAAESWQLRAAWEARCGLDPAASLQRSQALADLALQLNPHSGPCHAIKGMAEWLKARTQPENRPLLLAQAREQLLLAQGMEPKGRLTTWLRESMNGPQKSTANH